MHLHCQSRQPEHSETSDSKRKRRVLSDSEQSLDESPRSDCGVEEVTDNNRDRKSAVFSGKASATARPRNGLSREQAINIYSRRPDKMSFKKSRRGTMVGCEAVALEFGVTPKTIRDIWRGRTWGEATGHPQSDAESRSTARLSSTPQVQALLLRPRACQLVFEVCSIQASRSACPPDSHHCQQQPR
jgi:hypothetical protein